MLRIAYPRSSEGPSPETSRRRSGEWRPAAAARNQGPGRFGTPPARHYDLAARSSLHGSGRNAGDGSAAPDRKSPRWSAERRARPAGRAPRPSQRGPSRPTARQRKYRAFRRSARPSWGGWKRDKQNPGAATRRGNEGVCAMCGLRTRRHRDPTPLAHAAMAGLGEGHVADAGGEIAGERRAGRDMTQEGFPSDAVGVAVVRERRGLPPALAVIGGDILHHAEMRDRRGLLPRLHVALMQARQRRAFRAVDARCEPVVAGPP